MNSMENDFLDCNRELEIIPKYLKPHLHRKKLGDHLIPWEFQKSN